MPTTGPNAYTTNLNLHVKEISATVDGHRDTVYVEGTRFPDVVCASEDGESCTKLLPIHLLTYENGQSITLTLRPEDDITTLELMHINMLLLTETSKPGNVWIVDFVRKKNLERHFIFRTGHAPFRT